MSGNGLNAVVTKIIEVAPGLAIIRVRPDGWDPADFIPGQFAVLGLPGKAPRVELSDAEEEAPTPDKLIKRAYSIASASTEKEHVEFYITLIRSGALTPRLFALNEGGRVFLSGKFKGVFTIDRVPPDKNIAMIATGTGLAPYMSMIRTTLTHDADRRMAILHGARHSWDLGYRSELATLAGSRDNFAYLPIISRPDMEKTGWSAHSGYVQTLWQDHVIRSKWGFSPRPDNTHVFLCGAPAMIEDMVEILSKEGFREHTKKEPGEVHVERYW